jgi:hypothetical protein
MAVTWTHDADDLLRELFPQHGPAETGRLMGISADAVSSRARRLGLKAPKRYRTQGRWDDPVDEADLERRKAEVRKGWHARRYGGCRRRWEAREVRDPFGLT